MKTFKPILLVEDDIIDSKTVVRALKDVKVNNPVVVTTNGEEALVYLQNEQNEKPCIIMLDLNMPKMNGIEFLKVAKNDDTLRKIPVIILTTSSEELDKSETFGLGIAGYMIKPVDYQQFVEVIRKIDLYWSLSELPPL